LFRALSATLPSDRRRNAVYLIRERYICKEVNAFMVAHEMSTYPGASNSEREELMNWILERGEARGPYVEDAIRKFRWDIRANTNQSFGRLGRRRLKDALEKFEQDSRAYRRL
jgi:hypothetical protein